MSKYIPTIGLEIHAELNTKSKMFCDCKNDPDEQHPNVNVCPICLGHPGTLPVPNKDAIRHMMKIGLVLGGKIAEISKFDRKNYFYPDLPKGYQISQYDMPFVLGGELAGVYHPKFSSPSQTFEKFGRARAKLWRVKITRVHLEEDAGGLTHNADKRRLETPINADITTQINEEKSAQVCVDNNQRESAVSHLRESASLVDFNRAGRPLMELVTEPVIHDAETAVNFAKELQLILRYLGASEADMEKGQLRLEANISLFPNEEFPISNPQFPNKSQSVNDQNKNKLGTKVEVKNLNSFKILHDAIEYEIARQEEALEAGEKIKQETRGWDENKKKTVSQRSKEEAHDYRYFPEPDIPPFDIPKLFDLDELKAEIPELPESKRQRFAKEYSLSADKIEILIRDKAFADYFEEAASELAAFHVASDSSRLKENVHIKITDYNLLYSYLVNDLRGLLSNRAYTLADLKFGPEHFAHLLFFVYTNKVGSRVAKNILRIMVETGADPENILRDEGLEQVSDEGELASVVAEVIAENPEAVANYKGGAANALQFFVGKAMAKSKGKGNPKLILEILKKKLSE